MSDVEKKDPETHGGRLTRKRLMAWLATGGGVFLTGAITQVAKNCVDRASKAPTPPNGAASKGEENDRELSDPLSDPPHCDGPGLVLPWGEWAIKVTSIDETQVPLFLAVNYKDDNKTFSLGVVTPGASYRTSITTALVVTWTEGQGTVGLAPLSACIEPTPSGPKRWESGWTFPLATPGQSFPRYSVRVTLEAVPIQGF